MRNETAEADNPIVGVNDIPNQDSDALKLNVNTVSYIGKGDTTKGGDYENKDTTGDINMEAALTTDDVIRAGGFGATDDISNFLPVAVDLTDFEALLRDARDFEEPQGEISRPGLGWAEAKEKKDT